MVNGIAMEGRVQSTSAAGTARTFDDTAKIRNAAQQFEALLLGQILRTVRESSSGWLGSGGDSSTDCATEFAEQQVAAVMAQHGGLGLSSLIVSGLKKG